MNDITQLSTLYSNAIARAEKAEEERAEQWRQRREADASRDVAKALAYSFMNERDALRVALSEIIEAWDFWEVAPHDREPPRDAIRHARVALSSPPPPVRETP